MNTNTNTGGSDNTVVIWKSTGEGVLKYPHGGSVHSVKFRPFSLKLASCSDVNHNPYYVRKL
jgi:WD40 repeat protein